MDAADLVPLAGGWSGHTFLAEAGGQRSVVRIYPPGLRDDAAAEVDAAVLHLVRGLLPVPDVLEVRRGVAAADRPGLLVTSWLPGERGDLVIAGLDDKGLSLLGRHVGLLVGILGGMPTLRPGPFVDASLQVGDFGLADGLPGFVEAAGLRWDPDLVTRLVGVATDAQALLDTAGRACLVHSDLNPKNLLVDPETLEVTAVLDWEFAHSGHPFTDLGNALRFDRAPAYVEAVLAGYRERHAVPAGEALALARAADLWALVDLASRAGQNPVADRADLLLRAVATQGDLHAVPAGWTPAAPPA